MGAANSIAELISCTLSLYKRVNNISTPKKYAKTVKCQYCEKQIDRNIEPFETKNKKYYHANCFHIHEMSAQHRRELIDYICQLYEIEAPNGFMVKQIKTFQDEYKYTLKGIEFALRYFHDVMGNDIEADGIGIVPFIYNDAKKYYMTINDVRESTLRALEQEPSKVEIVKITNQPKRLKKYIDIGEL